MKWLFKIFLLLGILFTTGSGHSASTFHTFTSVNFIAPDEVQAYQHDLKFTPVQPLQDYRVFQIAEDEEDTTTSRVKRNTALAVLIYTFFYGAISVFQTERNAISPYQLGFVSLNSLPRYIRLRSIRV